MSRETGLRDGESPCAFKPWSLFSKDLLRPIAEEIHDRIILTRY